MTNSLNAAGTPQVNMQTFTWPGSNPLGGAIRVDVPFPHKAWNAGLENGCVLFELYALSVSSESEIAILILRDGKYSPGTDDVIQYTVYEELDGVEMFPFT